MFSTTSYSKSFEEHHHIMYCVWLEISTLALETTRKAVPETKAAFKLKLRNRFQALEEDW